MSTARILTMAQAISEGIAQEMSRDANVFVMGEDIGSYGGIFGATGGLLDKFGKDRIMDTPISETAFIGAATGAAACPAPRGALLCGRLRGQYRRPRCHAPEGPACQQQGARLDKVLRAGGAGLRGAGQWWCASLSKSCL